MKCGGCGEEITLYEDRQWHVTDFYLSNSEAYLEFKKYQKTHGWRNGFCCPWQDGSSRKHHFPEPEVVAYVREQLG